MRLGFLTACLPRTPLDEIVGWAEAEGFAGLEVAVWPDVPGREWEASHIDVTTLDAAAACDVRNLFDEHGLDISALAYYENNLDSDPAPEDGSVWPLPSEAAKNAAEVCDVC